MSKRYGQIIVTGYCYWLLLLVIIIIIIYFSRQLAEEVLKTPPTTGEETTNGEGDMNGFEGMEVLAKAIETSNIYHPLVNLLPSNIYMYMGYHMA